MRLQRAMARAGVASRRRSEELIRAGKVRVNGEVATIGAVVDPERDAITVSDKAVSEATHATLVLHKPIGYVVSRRDPEGRETIFSMVPDIPGLTYAGRLDFMSSGLLILTTDGELANRLTHPRYEVPRSYSVKVHDRPTGEISRALSQTLVIDGRPVGIASADVRSIGGGSSEITLTLVEGRNRIVRRVCEQLGVVVENLVRLSHGPIQLGDLKEGEWRRLTARERRQLDRLGVVS